MRITLPKLTWRDGGELPQRQVIVAYLRYAVDDVEHFNGTSAILLRQAIACLENPQADETRLVRQ
jgi:hypothetical protein